MRLARIKLNAGMIKDRFSEIKSRIYGSKLRLARIKLSPGMIKFAGINSRFARTK